MDEAIETYAWLEGEEAEAFLADVKRVEKEINLDNLLNEDSLVIAEALRRLARSIEQAVFSEGF